ncbi:MAG: glutamate synthase subunit alpha, partial [Aestuariivirgaceae bacterium]
MARVYGIDGLDLRPEGIPAPRGLYDAARDHDACGIGLYANINNLPSHTIIESGLTILKNLEHRGAVGADPKAGDGAGIMTQLPHEFFLAEAERLKFRLPTSGQYGVGYLFMPREANLRQEIERIWRETAIEEGLRVIGWRDVPVDDSVLGVTVKKTEPWHRQMFITAGPTIRDEIHFERKLFICRKVVSNRVIEVLGRAARGYYPVSVSTRTIVYKGLVLGKDLGAYYCDLGNEKFASSLALVHQRFSTNTFPAWPLAHPYRYICHNGEINTLRGNYNWMAARQANMKSEVLGKDLDKLWPISYEGQSDSACFDNALE